MAKKKKKFKHRRHFSFREEVLPKQAKVDLMIAGGSIARAFPDRIKREKYIKDLIHGLETEPIMELQ